MTSREVPLIAYTMVELSVLKLGQELLPLRSYGRSMFFILNWPIVNKTRVALGKFVQKFVEMFRKNSPGLVILFATMSDPPTHNFQFLVQPSLQV